MDRQAFFAIADTVLDVGMLLIAFLCVKSALAALRNKSVTAYGQKATRAEEPLGYWLVILSLLLVAGIFVFAGLKDWVALF